MVGARPILLDTGPIVAILDASDEHHTCCVDELHHIQAPLLTSWPVITEAAWLLRAWPAVVGKLMASLSSGLFELADLTRTDLPPIAAILARYRTLGIQLADASLVHLANREGIETVFTLDRRDFTVLRHGGGKKFHLIP